jgi:hypothetical protein
MRFICLGYAEEAQWEGASKSEQKAMMEKCLAYDDVLRKNGHTWGSGEALQSSRTAKTLRWKNGKVIITDGPYAETKEQLGGFGVLEARDMNEAVELMSKHPGLRYGPFEIRPTDEQANAQCHTGATTEPTTTKEGAKFLCLGYMEEAKWDAMSKDEQEAFMKECLAYDDVLRKNGHWAGGEALQYARTAKTLSWKSGKVMVTDGPYAETKEQLGGVVVILAKDLNHAVELMSKHPGVRFGVHLEIRPADEEINALIAAREAAKQSEREKQPSY